jgi:hypothetical protein
MRLVDFAAPLATRRKVELGEGRPAGIARAD